MPPLEQAELFQPGAPRPARRVFLGWERPLVDLAVEFLTSQYSGTLRSTLVVVPSRQSGHRLRDALGRLEPGADIPEIVTPEFLYSPRPDAGATLAGPGETLAAWALALREIDLAPLRHLFPIDPPERNFAWAMGTARDLLGVRATLGEAGLLVADVPERLGDAFGDTQRWREFAQVEQAATAKLSDAGLIDTAATRQAAARSPAPIEGVGDIALVGLPDPPPIAVQTLGNLTPKHEISVAVFAHDSDAGRFDGWGRPTAEGWGGCGISIPDPEHSIQLAADPPGQGHLVADAVARHPDPAGLAAVGVADPELLPHLAAAFDRRGLVTRRPGGRPSGGHELHALLRLLCDLLATRAFAPASEIARHPDFLDSAASSYQPDGDIPPGGTRFDAGGALAAIDKVAADHLPATLPDALAFARHSSPSARHLLGRVSTWADRLGEEPLRQALPEFLADTFARREFDLSGREGGDFAEVAAALRKALDDTAPLAAGSISNAEALELALAALRDTPLFDPREPGAIDLHGWLEMLWEDAPHLVVAGANDGKLPEAMGRDSFLPQRARRALGLRDHTDRLVRDSYLLSAILAPRRDGGRVDLVLGRTSDAGDPLRPSRLLFRCPDDQLPERALRLCRGDELTPPPGAPWQPAWKLRPPGLPEGSPVFERIAVTGFRRYLACPFRFYLKSGLGMEEIETGKLEMNARDFGNICHLALDALGKHEVLRDSSDADEIRDFLCGQLEARAQSRYGRDLSVPLAFQFESAKQRLAWAAGRLAAERAAGWRIEHSEWELHGEHDWRIGGLSVRGTIDRIERHQGDGRWRVLDYKTSARPGPPRDAHLLNLRRRESRGDFPPWALLDHEGKTLRWADLQLPLYVLALRELLDAGEVAAGYFNIAPSAGATGIAVWDGLDEPLLAAARACATGVADAIRQGQFWPPAENPAYDEFAPILFGDPETLSEPPPARKT